MDGDSWSARLSTASKRYRSTLQSRSDMFMGFEEIHGDDDVREEFPCPFCSEYYDIVGLCPVCSLRVGIDMVHTLPRSSRHHHLRRKENPSVHHHLYGPFDEARSHCRS
ncbi:putative protein DEHYDRATION-INDUCED 19 [Rosa chinensis]|uniref:Drought induced 19 type, zinc-binding protein n=1 Tax=Rosa chinensis TaxID=74649 RepID=A0A2P6QWW3_ROSCH|nr:putative protein DEHYDRATION-INDUCED 19 [Rosa chinensis]